MGYSRIFVLLLFGAVMTIRANCLDDEKIVDINVDSAPLIEVLESLAHAHECTILFDGSLSGVVSLHVKGATWLELFASIAMQQHLVLKRSPHVISVSRALSSVVVMPMMSKQVWLRHVVASDVISQMKNDAKGVLSAQGRVLAIHGGSALLIYEHMDRVYSVLEFIHACDQARPHVRIVAKMVYLEDELVENLGLRWADGQGWRIGLPIFDLNAFAKDSASTLSAQVQLYEQTGSATVIARPKVLTISGVEASIESGEQIPYQEKVGHDGVGLTFKKAVLQLKILPEVLAERRVHLRILVNQDQVSPRLVRGVPMIQTQNLHTEVTVGSGETIVLGGVFRQGNGIEYRGLPWWQRMISMRWLFGQNSNHAKRQQLLVFLTPVIVD